VHGDGGNSMLYFLDVLGEQGRGEGIEATHIRNRTFRNRRTWPEREISRKRLWWSAQTVPMTRKLIACPRYEGHRYASFPESDSVVVTWGTPISMIRRVIAMANTPSEKVSILPV
ncbi:MAG TPA: hypothetical protein VJ827_00735, partial [Rubrobacter sp.]|nr:hypothetical protein [Rubrobacter sp.]